MRFLLWPFRMSLSAWIMVLSGVIIVVGSMNAYLSQDTWLKSAAGKHLFQAMNRVDEEGIVSFGRFVSTLQSETELFQKQFLHPESSVRECQEAVDALFGIQNEAERIYSTYRVNILPLYIKSDGCRKAISTAKNNWLKLNKLVQWEWMVFLTIITGIATFFFGCMLQIQTMDKRMREYV